MKIVRMLGGLANRMFQYSLYEYIKSLGYDTKVDNYYVPTKWKMEEIDWNRIFPNAPLDMPCKAQIFLYGGGYDIISKLRRKMNLSYNIYTAPSAFSIPSAKEIKENNYFTGVFQHAEMVEKVEKIIRQKYFFSPFEDDKNKNIFAEMKECNSIAVHVRKGEDYLKRTNLVSVCNMEYYYEAFNYIKSRVENPVFYVFTDNPDWVKEHFAGIDYKLVNHNPSMGWGNHFDMQLMSCAKHNIIANSTYSWWGAFLNTNENKIIIGPKKWFGEGSLSSRYENLTFPSSWIQL